MNTELENIQQQVSALQENTDLITQDIVRIMPTKMCIRDRLIPCKQTFL